MKFDVLKTMTFEATQCLKVEATYKELVEESNDGRHVPETM